MVSSNAYINPVQFDSENLELLRDAKLSLDKYSHLLIWKEQERVVDVGCGTGNVTKKILEPHLPADYKLLVGFDLSEHNVKYAEENYGGSHITYLQGDIAEPDLQTLNGFFEKENISTGFDKVFSLHCLHWVKNSVQWSRNVYSLLKPGGQTFLQFITNSVFMEVWIEAAFSERWIPYTKTVGPLRPEFHYSKDVNSDLIRVMTDAGFTVESCDHWTTYTDVQKPERFLSLMKSADPYVHSIPEELQADYFEDLRNVYNQYLRKYAETGIPYTVAVIVASKTDFTSVKSV